MLGKESLIIVLVLVTTNFSSVKSQYNCYVTAATATCKAPTASSSYYFWDALYGPVFAVDNTISYSNRGFFHSNYEAYPYWKVELTAAIALNAVRFWTRCDANQWWHFQNIEIRAHTAEIVTIPGLPGANWATAGTVCTNMAYSYWWQCGAITKACNAPQAATLWVTVQQLVLDTMGGTNNGWGNQHSNAPFYFLMMNEIDFY